jgi:hypothetical protein
MNKKIFILNGSGGVGKDTFVHFVSKYIPAIHFSSVTKVKEIAKEIGWDGGKTERDRKFLSDLKMLCTEYNNMPFNSIKDKVSEFLNMDALALFIDIREPDEIEMAKQTFNASTILVIRNSIEHITSNVADKCVFDYSYDFIINNNGTLDELENEALNFVREVYGGVYNGNCN